MLGKNILSQNCVPALYATQSTSWGFSLPPFRLVKHADGTLDTVLINDVNSRTTSTLIAMAAVHQTETTETCCPQMDFSYAKKKKKSLVIRCSCSVQKSAVRRKKQRNKTITSIQSPGLSTADQQLHEVYCLSRGSSGLNAQSRQNAREEVRQVYFVHAANHAMLLPKFGSTQSIEIAAQSERKDNLATAVQTNCLDLILPRVYLSRGRSRGANGRKYEHGKELRGVARAS